ncbi:MAG TPA: hypothetical protein VGB46_05300 [Flavisolibacter sp.]|jgi:hypothetical protein
MNQKALRYVLIAAVVLVWGAIIYRIFAALGSDDGPEPGTAVASKPLKQAARDSFSLLANYSDPFLPADAVMEPDVAVDSPVVTSNPAVVSTSLPATEPPVDISFVRYQGMIANPEKKLRMAMISINGSEHLVKENEVIQDVLIRKITANKLTVTYRKKTFHISGGGNAPSPATAQGQ